MPAPRVAIVIGKLDRGGTERHLLTVLPLLKTRGINLAVFTLQAGGVLVGAMRDAGVEVFEGASHRGWWALPVMAVRLARHLRRYGPDVTHFYLPEAYVVGSICAMLATRSRRVMSRRSLNNYQRKYPGIRFLECALHRVTAVLLGNSRAVVAQLEAEGARATQIGLIYNGIASTPLPTSEQVGRARADLGLADDTIAGLTIGNLIPYKGHATLLAAIAALPDRYKNALVWFCVGRDDGVGAELRRYADELGIGAIVRWEGERDDISVYLEACDIAALPSRQEGFSNSLLEKMRAALATVATDVGGNPDALDGCGLLVPPDDASSLMHALTTLFEDGERAALGRAARERVVNAFGLDRCAELYVELYDNLAAGRFPSVPRPARVGMES